MSLILCGPVATVSAPGVADATRLNVLGQRAFDDAGNEFIYLAGVASNVAYDAVSFNATTYVAVRLAADAVGRVAITPNVAITAASWGWFQIYGFGTVNSDTVAGAGGLFIDGTAGRVDDASVAGDFVNGLLSTGADVANVLGVNINYPYVTNTVPA